MILKILIAIIVLIGALFIMFIGGVGIFAIIIAIGILFEDID